MKILETLSELHKFSDNDKLDLLILIESHKYHDAINKIRGPGENIRSVARIIKRIAKEELNMDIMPYLE